MTDRAPVEVEVRCPSHYHDGTYQSKDCTCCGGYAGFNHKPEHVLNITATLAPGSLDEAIYRLGLLAESFIVERCEELPPTLATQQRGIVMAAYAEVRRLREARH